MNESFTSNMDSGSLENVIEKSSSDLRGQVHEHVTKFLILVVCFSALTGLLMGFDLSIIAVVLTPIQKTFNLCKPDTLVCFKRNLFVSMIAPGALIGSLSGGYVADKFGRKWTLALSDIAFIGGSITFYFALSFEVLLLARSLIGLGVGIGFVVFSTYVTEISPAYIRGRLVVCQEIAQCLGVLLTFLIASNINDSYWRLFLAMGGIAAFIQLCSVFFLPESPRWLLMNDQIDAARQNMEKLGIQDFMLDSEYLQQSGSGINQNSALTILFKNKKIIIIACFVGIAQNILCTNAVLYYSTDLFLIAGICKPYQWGNGLGIMKLIGVILVYFTCDKIGRKPLILIGSVGLSIVAYGISPYRNDIKSASSFCRTASDENLNILGIAGKHSIMALISIFGFVLFWEISWASLMYVVASEMIPSEIRGIGMGCVIFCFWASLFISQLAFETSFSIITITGTFFGLGILAIIIAIITFFIVPDMTGKSLENITRFVSHIDSLSTGATMIRSESLESQDEPNETYKLPEVTKYLLKSEG